MALRTVSSTTIRGPRRFSLHHRHAGFGPRGDDDTGPADGRRRGALFLISRLADAQSRQGTLGGKRFLPDFDIHFLPAINEILPPPRFGARSKPVCSAMEITMACSIWYGKGPGIDRTTPFATAIRMARRNMAGCRCCRDDHALISTIFRRHMNHCSPIF